VRKGAASQEVERGVFTKLRCSHGALYQPCSAPLP